MIFEVAGQLDIYQHLLFELRMRLSGLLASGGRAEDRERVACGLGRWPGVDLARLARLSGMVVTPRGPDTLHVLSTPYELLGDKRISSAELMVKL